MRHIQGGLKVALILAIDDAATDLALIQYILTNHEVILARNGEQGLQQLEEHPQTDLILLDLHMPVMDGFTFMDRYHELNLDIPIIILTNTEEVAMEIQGLEKGAVDFIRKPLNFKALQMRIDVQLRLKQSTELIKEHNRHLEELVEKRTREIRRTNEITINALVRLLEVRNIETSDHARRTKIMMELLCKQLQKVKPIGYELSDKEIQELIDTAPLHDIGKVGIPDCVLLKPGKLDPDEIAIMREHVNKGVEALDYSIESEDSKISFIEMARTLIASHHEWYDGSGYPEQLRGLAIPLSGRLMAVIDVYDALTSKRVYKEKLDQAKAIEVMKMEADRHFDPVVFEAFLQVVPQINMRMQE
jgi:putative two-component system response regulator